jgi:hypothetical protein
MNYHVVLNTALQFVGLAFKIIDLREVVLEGICVTVDICFDALPEDQNTNLYGIKEFINSYAEFPVGAGK